MFSNYLHILTILQEFVKLGIVIKSLRIDLEYPELKNDSGSDRHSHLNLFNLLNQSCDQQMIKRFEMYEEKMLKNDY